MKARLRILTVLIVVCIASLAAAVIAGCSIGRRELGEILDEAEMTAFVTYYSNGGNFGESSTSYKTLTYRDGNPILNVGAEGSPIPISRINHVFLGWKKTLMTQDGAPLLHDAAGNALEVKDTGSPKMYDANGVELIEQDKIFTAEYDENGSYFFDGVTPVIHDGEHLYLSAVWTEDVGIDILLGGDRAITITVNDQTKTVQPGELLETRYFGADSAIDPRPDRSPATGSGYTYVHLYYDKALSKDKIVNSGEKVNRPAEGEENAVLYAQYIEGNWEIVKTASDARNMFGSGLAGNKNYYILFDNIDMSGLTPALPSSYATFNGKIEGNGNTISNVNFAALTGTQDGTIWSIFGKLGANAEIHNLIIDTVTMDLTAWNNHFKVYLLSSEIAEGAKIDGLEVRNAQVSIALKGNGGNMAVIDNMPLEDGQFNTDSWYCGSFATNDEFLKAYGGVTITDATVTNKS